MESSRFTQGQQALNSVHGHIGQDVMAALGDIAPDFARMIIEFPYGDVFSRGVLSSRERQIATIASLVTQGHSGQALKAHIQGALNVGCAHQDIVELIMHLAVYAGFPSAVNAMLAAKEVFAQTATPKPPDTQAHSNAG